MSCIIERARVMTSGKRITILGGIPYVWQKRNLEVALNCIILWSPAERGKRLRAVTNSVEGSDLIIVVVKLCSHALNDFALCIRRAGGTPVVMAKAGLNPLRIAYDIVTQLSAPV